MSEIKTTDDIDKLFKEKNLTKYAEAIKAVVRPTIEIVKLASDENLKIGTSKIGGTPDLKNETQWPKTDKSKSMSFIAQINCEEISKYDVQELLPKKGLISFFYCPDQEAWGFDPKDKDSFKVIYTEKIEYVKNRKFPEDLEEHSIFNCNPIEFNSCLSFPNYLDEVFDNEKNEDIYQDLLYDYTSDNQLFGYANIVQNPMELECQLVTNGLYCGDPSGYNDPKAKELEKEKSDWILLLQIGSDDYEESNIMWGDSGRIYFWIKKQDLKEKNFNNVWTILQCF